MFTDKNGKPLKPGDIRRMEDQCKNYLQERLTELRAFAKTEDGQYLFDGRRGQALLRNLERLYQFAIHHFFVSYANDGRKIEAQAFYDLFLSVLKERQSELIRRYIEMLDTAFKRNWAAGVLIGGLIASSDSFNAPSDSFLTLRSSVASDSDWSALLSGHSMRYLSPPKSLNRSFSVTDSIDLNFFSTERNVSTIPKIDDLCSFLRELEGAARRLFINNRRAAEWKLFLEKLVSCRALAERIQAGSSDASRLEAQCSEALSAMRQAAEQCQKHFEQELQTMEDAQKSSKILRFSSFQKIHNAYKAGLLSGQKILGEILHHPTFIKCFPSDQEELQPAKEKQPVLVEKLQLRGVCAQQFQSNPFGRESSRTLAVN